MLTFKVPNGAVILSADDERGNEEPVTTEEEEPETEPCDECGGETDVDFLINGLCKECRREGEV